jgi:hypothetical protein
MIYDPGESQGVYLFVFGSLEDGAADFDNWFATVAEAEASAETEHGVQPEDWQPIPDPAPGEQHDRLPPGLS